MTHALRFSPKKFLSKKKIGIVKKINKQTEKHTHIYFIISDDFSRIFLSNHPQRKASGNGQEKSEKSEMQLR